MAAGAAALFKQHMTAEQAMAGSSPKTQTTGSGGTTGSNASTDSATISANDFLTLLVTEMQNQDPTADTDPNEYINQLVQVNSLEQLIDINQTLTTDSTPAPSTSSANTPAAAAAAGSASPLANSAASPSIAGKANLMSSAESAPTAGTGAAQSASKGLAPGNLSVPKDSPAAEGVAHALDGRFHSHR